jgi:hypothetical protein
MSASGPKATSQLPITMPGFEGKAAVQRILAFHPQH